MEGRGAYGSRDEEAGEEVEQRVEGRGQDGGHLVVRRDRHGHHSIVGEVQEGGEVHEEEPEELLGRPLEAQHCVDDEGVVGRLDEHIGDFHDHLHQIRHIFISISLLPRRISS